MGAEANGEIDRFEYNKNRLAGLYEEYFDKIAHYIYVRLRDLNEAENLAGEVFVKALKSLGSYQERGVPMQAWLFKIARNLIVDYSRKAAKQKTVPIDDLQVIGEDNPQAAAEKKIELERVKKAMEYLTKDQKEVINLRFFGGLSSKEAGQILKKSDGAIREMQRSAIEKLRRLLTANDIVSG